MKSNLLLLLLYLVCLTGSAQDKLIFKTGLEYTARILYTTETQVAYINYYKQEETKRLISKSDLIYIKYATGKKEILDEDLYLNPPTLFVQEQKTEPQKAEVIEKPKPAPTPAPKAEPITPTPAALPTNDANESSSKVETLMAQLKTALTKSENTDNKLMTNQLAEIKKGIESINQANAANTEVYKELLATLKSTKTQQESQQEKEAKSPEQMEVRTLGIGFSVMNSLTATAGGNTNPSLWGGGLNVSVNFRRKKKIGFKLEPEIILLGNTNNNTTIVDFSLGSGFYLSSRYNRVCIYGGPFLGFLLNAENSSYIAPTVGANLGLTLGGEYLITSHFSIGMSGNFLGQVIHLTNDGSQVVWRTQVLGRFYF